MMMPNGMMVPSAAMAMLPGWPGGSGLATTMVDGVGNPLLMKGASQHGGGGGGEGGEGPSGCNCKKSRCLKL